MAKVRKSSKVSISGKNGKKRVSSHVYLTSFVNDLEVAEATSYKNLYVYPVFRQTLKKVGLKTLSEALKDGLVEIKETGVVKEIEVVNKSKDVKILIMEGDIVKGGAQNRILNVSMIIDEESSVKVPCTCVQQGRWNNFDAKFTEIKTSSPSMSKAHDQSVFTSMCSSRGSSLYAADQSKVWSEVNCYLAGAGSHDTTKDYTSAYTSKSDDIKEYKDAFKGKLPEDDESLVGLIVSVGKVVKFDICADHAMFTLHMDNLLEGCYLDAVSIKDETKEYSAKDMTDFLNSIITSKVEEFDTPNKLGVSVVFTGDQVKGNALLYKEDIVHLSAFNS